MIASCLDTRSFSVPAIVDYRTDNTPTDHRRRTAADITPTVVSARVDSGVSGMQSSVCTLSSSATQQHEPPPKLGVEASDWSAHCVDAAVGSSPVWNLSQMSMDVRSCPGDTAGSSCVTQLPPLYLCQYVNGYSDAMLMHVDDRRQHPGLYSSSDVGQAAWNTATHCAGVADDNGPRRRGDSTETVPVSRGGLTVQTTAIVEPRRATCDKSPCVCGQTHELPSPLPPPLSAICGQALDLPPSIVRDLPPPLHFPPPPSSICGEPLDLPPPPDCARQRPTPLDTAVNVSKDRAPSSPSELERRRLLTRLLLGLHDELTLSPVYVDETYF